MSSALNVNDFVHAAPILFVTAWACLVLLASALSAGKSFSLGPITAMGALLGIVVCAWSWSGHADAATIFSGMIVVDRFALFLDIIFLAGALLTAMLSSGYLEEHRFTEGEFYAVIMLVVVGMMVMVHAGDFITVIIGLETMSLGVYSLVACWGGRRKSAEAGLKYFIMGAVASAFLLYGIALLYGITGSTSLSGISSRLLGHAGEPLAVIGMLMILGALGFKVALVPFHMWTPDAYEGAPTPITGLMAAAVKAAGFGVLLRIVTVVFGADYLTYGSTGWVNIFITLSALTMTVGNVLALRQDNIKRMLAYSSISHAGYLLLGVIATAVVSDAATAEARASLLFYLLQYAVTTLGAFGVVAWLGRRDAERDAIERWAGLGKEHPVAALAMTIFLLSLAGIPPMSGFFAKFYLFKSALSHPGLLTLVIIGALNSVIAIFYYLKPVVEMYFRESYDDEVAAPIRSSAMTVAMVIAVALVLLLGLLPGSSIEWAGQSGMAF